MKKLLVSYDWRLRNPTCGQVVFKSTAVSLPFEGAAVGVVPSLVSVPFVSVPFVGFSSTFAAHKVTDPPMMTRKVKRRAVDPTSRPPEARDILVFGFEGSR